MFKKCTSITYKLVRSPSKGKYLALILKKCSWKLHNPWLTATNFWIYICFIIIHWILIPHLLILIDCFCVLWPVFIYISLLVNNFCVQILHSLIPMNDRYIQTISASKLKVLFSITIFFEYISPCNNVRNKSKGIPSVF
jgi:hypothetical protein